MFLNGVPLLDALALGARRKHSFICWDANIQISVLALCYSAARSFVATSKSFSHNFSPLAPLSLRESKFADHYSLAAISKER
jgi:hypothetical protein